MDVELADVNFMGTDYEIAFRHRKRSHDLVIFLHGIGCSQDSFQNVWADNVLEDFSILSFDFPGFGHSSRPFDFSYSMEDQAKLCDALLLEFPESRMHFVVHSMGGAIGLLLCDEILQSAVSFVNIEGNLIKEDCDLVSRRTISIPYEEFEKKFIHRQETWFDNEQSKYFDLTLASPQAFYKSCESLVWWSDSGKLLRKFRRLNCRKAYIYGEQNLDMPILTKLGDIKTISINRSGHFVMNDNPGEFYSRLYSFLRE